MLLFLPSIILLAQEYHPPKGLDAIELIISSTGGKINKTITANSIDTGTTLASGIGLNEKNYKNRKNIFGGIGYAPFKLNIGIGYFLTDKIETNIQYYNLFMPLSLNVDIIS